MGLLLLRRLLLLLLLLLRLSHPCKCVRDDWSEPIHNMHLHQHVITHSENTADACSKPNKKRAQTWMSSRACARSSATLLPTNFLNSVMLMACEKGRGQGVSGEKIRVVYVGFVAQEEKGYGAVVDGGAAGW